MFEGFIGLTPPQVFLDNFLNVKGCMPDLPEVDFSKMPEGGSVSEMRAHFVEVVETSGLCPGTRMFIPRMTNHQMNDDAMYHSKADTENASRSDFLPALAIRAQRRPQPNHMRSRELEEYCNFSTYLLGIDIQHDIETDPFMELDDALLSWSSDADSMASRDIAAKASVSESTLSFITGYVPEESPSYGPPSEPPYPSGNQGCAPLEPEIGPELQSPHALEQQAGASAGTPPCKNISASSPSDDGAAVKQETCTHGSPSIVSPSSQASSTHSRFVLSFPIFIERPTRKATAVRNAIMSHVGTQFLRQHRRFLFHLVLLGRSARFLRFDRSGAVVSKLFDFVASPTLLAQFLWRFAHMTDDERGLDPSATLANRAETRLFTAAVEGFLYGAGRRLPHAERTLDTSGSFPTWKIHVTNPATGDSTALIVRRPFAAQTTIFGRSTRAYIAFDLQSHHLLFFKDSWRAERQYLRPEFQTFLDLHAHHVPHIPEILYGGDVQEKDGRVQETLSSLLSTAREPWRFTTSALHRRVHHRIVQKIYYPLEGATSVREFLKALHDVLIAVDRAQACAGILHRDLSYRNIMLDSDGRGVLNDWDHAGTEQEAAHGIGTWEFMSIRLLYAGPEKNHELVDDLESFFWVLLYAALKQFALPGQYLPFDMFHYRFVCEDGRAFGGNRKAIAVLYPQNDIEPVRFVAEPLRALIADMRLRWRDYHRAKDWPPGYLEETQWGREILATAQRALNPGFWAERVAAAIQALDGTEEIIEENLPSASTAVEGVVLSAQVPLSKRKLSSSSAQYSSQHPRRSKRLRRALNNSSGIPLDHSLSR